VTRFSGRPAPEHPGAPPNIPHFVQAEAYSHEVSSCGFWLGGGPVNEPVFYVYAYPEPQSFKDYTTQPPEAFYHIGMVNSYYPTMWFVLRSHLMRSCSPFCRAPMKQLQRVPKGSIWIGTSVSDINSERLRFIIKQMPNFGQTDKLCNKNIKK
jgi:hypothetical protein